MNIVFDSFALITIFREEPGHAEVIEWLSKIGNGTKGYMSVINLGEIYYITSRKQNKENAELALSSTLQLPIEFIDADFNHTYRAALLKAKYQMSYSDAFAASLAIQLKATLITGDPEFKNLDKEPGLKIHFIKRS